jgi:hypothetical protein
MRWKSRFIAFIVCFVIGFLAASIVAAILRSLFSRKLNKLPASPLSLCVTTDYFNSPEEVLAALKNPEVSVRRKIFSQLLLRPDIGTIYYDYERDLNYPERADRALLRYVQLDDSKETEALLTFVRFEHPVALVFKQDSCGWRLVSAISSWLRFEDYPYDNWLSLPETIEPGIHQLLIRESHGDSTSYVRKARLLQLNGNALTQIAEIEEEAIEPVSSSDGSSDVKRHRFSHYDFVSGSAGEKPTIKNDVTDEIIKFSGAAPRYSYWLETDGSWHARESNWNRRPATRVKILGLSRNFLRWNPHEERFVNY